MSTSRRSIISNRGRRSRGGPKKRLSFAPTPEKETTALEYSGDVSQPDETLTLAESSCKVTSFGLCYDRQATPTEMLGQHDSIPMKETRRSNFMPVLAFTSPSGTTADVLIAGDMILGEKFKAYLLDVHNKQHTMQGLKRMMDLNITCQKTLTPAKISTAHFIIYLLVMDTHESLMDLSNFLESYNEDILPRKRIMIVPVSSAQGCFKNVIDKEQFYSLLDSYQLIHFPWKEQGRLGQIDVKRILDSIYKSVWYRRGTSLLTDYIMQLKIDWSLNHTEAQE